MLRVRVANKRLCERTERHRRDRFISSPCRGRALTPILSCRRFPRSYAHRVRNFPLHTSLYTRFIFNVTIAARSLIRIRGCSAGIGYTTYTHCRVHQRSSHTITASGETRSVYPSSPRPQPSPRHPPDASASVPARRRGAYASRRLILFRLSSVYDTQSLKGYVTGALR